jgi:hypothetical protein
MARPKAKEGIEERFYRFGMVKSLLSESGKNHVEGGEIPRKVLHR